METSSLIDVIDVRGRTLTPCKRKVAEREVRLHRAQWIGRDRIRLRFDPFAYRYVRLKVLERDGHRCYWCGDPGFTMDHVIPWSQGGKTALNNCVCACEECNGKRGDLPAVQFAKICGVPLPAPGGGAPGQSPRFEPSRRPVGLPTPASPRAVAVAAQPEPLPAAPVPIIRPMLHLVKPTVHEVAAQDVEIVYSVALAHLLDPHRRSVSSQSIR